MGGFGLLSHREIKEGFLPRRLLRLTQAFEQGELGPSVGLQIKVSNDCEAFAASKIRSDLAELSASDSDPQGLSVGSHQASREVFDISSFVEERMDSYVTEAITSGLSLKEKTDGINNLRHLRRSLIRFVRSKPGPSHIRWETVYGQLSKVGYLLSSDFTFDCMNVGKRLREGDEPHECRGSHNVCVDTLSITSRVPPKLRRAARLLVNSGLINPIDEVNET
jgi:hypothetical protein